ncbi:MAG: homocysteine S-methyltransferase family protein [Clostridia bacterium]|nr:homocysteine S-methyltransferase family protein [Clostridia bacterium]
MLLDFLKNNTVFLDGSIGTYLQSQGLKAGEKTEEWNITHPEAVCNIHKAYFDAGSNIVNTNTFGANSLHFNDGELEEIIASAVSLVKKARDESTGTQEKFIALDIGPTGKLLKPYGELDFEDAVQIFAKTVSIGVKYGVDLIFIETMNDLYETKAALLAAKENCSLPVFVSNAYSEDGKLMTGASPDAVISLLEGMNADAIGVNCSLGPDALQEVIDEYLTYSSLPVIFKPNAGLPENIDGKTVYNINEDKFSDEIALSIKKGVRCVGGCCGTNDKYIKAVYDKCKALPVTPVTQKNRSVVSSYTHTVEFGKTPVLIGERINPTGKKLLKEALRNNDMEYILKEGLGQEEKQVHILDVNVGLPEIDEKEMLTKAVCNLQSVLNLPLQIDTAKVDALESALRRYNGKAMINSVNGKEESMKAVFPLVRKYGGLVVALTLDENGIPETAQGRVQIAKKIIKTAKQYGIDKKDLIFDTLCLSVSADKNAAVTTLEAMSIIKNELGCNTTLGVSNISFGLPQRDVINSTFFTMALQKGLSAAIMNPYSAQMMSAYYAFNALSGTDENCSSYIDFAGTLTVSQSLNTDAIQKTQTAASSPLQEAIIKGLKDNAGELTKTLLETKEPLSIVQEEIIPALDIVGKGFENKTVYLPQLLMSAESAKTAFEQIKLKMKNQKNENRTSVKFVLATVKGDIHDIGKNIVKLLLENYGFEVIDLGKDVPPADVLNAVKEHHAPLAGLSALMTTTLDAMEETVKLIKEQAEWCKIIVGGAVLTEEYAKKIGADKYAKDAMETVRFAQNI